MPAFGGLTEWGTQRRATPPRPYLNVNLAFRSGSAKSGRILPVSIQNRIVARLP
jgi:hypothetical protein